MTSAPHTSAATEGENPPIAIPASRATVGSSRHQPVPPMARQVGAQPAPSGTVTAPGDGAVWSPANGRSADARHAADERAGLAAALARARAGDEAGFVILYRTLQPRLQRYATALVGHEAEDVTAEAWLQVARDLKRFVGDVDGFRGWVASITRNRALDLLRSRSRRPADPAGLSVLADRAGPGDTATAALDALSTAQAVALIAGLPRDQAEAVLLRAVVGLDAKAAGQVLGKRAGAVRVAAHRGLRRLASQLADGSSAESRKGDRT